MTDTCIACGGRGFSTTAYKNASSDRGISRFVKDALQWMGWNVLPLQILPASLSRRFAQGLFKFKKVRICSSCGLGILDPMPSSDDLNKFYAYFFDLEMPTGKLPQIHPRGASQANHLAQAVDLTGIHDTLEFGSGDAALTRTLKQHKPALKSTVVEVSRHMLGPLESDPAIDAVLEDYRGQPENFDLVMSSHSLEHVYDVRETLGRLSSWVRPGGWLMIEVPHANPDHYSVDHEYVPHGYFFTKKSLSLLVEAAGMETVFISGGGQTWREARQGIPYPTDPQIWMASSDAGANLRGLWRKRPVV